MVTEKSIEPSPSELLDRSHYPYVTPIARGASIVFTGGIISFVLRYLFQVLVARQIGVSDFGIFSLAVASFTVFEVVASLGTTKGIIRFVSLYSQEKDYARVRGTIHITAALVLGGGVILFVLVYSLAGFLALEVFHSPKLVDIFKFMGLCIPFTALTTVFLSSTQGLKIMKYKVYVRDLFEQSFRIFLVFLFFLFGLRIWGAIFSFVISILAGTVLSGYFYRKVFRPHWQKVSKTLIEYKKIISYSWPLVFASGFLFLEAWLSVFMLGFLATPKEVGIFSAAYKTSLLVQGIIMSFNTMFSPIISDLHHKMELKKLQSLFEMVTRWMFSLSLPLILIMCIFPQEILSIFGKDFMIGGAAFIILSISQLINAFSGPLGVMIDMSGRSKITFLNSVLHFLLQAILCLILIPRYGVTGAALAKLISILFLRVLLLLQVHHFLSMHPFGFQLLKPVTAGCGAFVLLYFLKNSILVIDNILLFIVAGATLFLVIYSLLLYLLGINEEDKLVFEKLKSKLAFR